MAYADAPIESKTDHLLLAFTDQDLRDPSDFGSWASNVDAIVGGGTNWDGRYFADPDQRPGAVNVPQWSYLAPFGFQGDESALRRALVSLH